MIHVRSEDRASGTIGDAKFNMSSPLAGTFSLIHTHLQPGDIPWIYPQANQIRLRRTTDNVIFLVDLGTISSQVEATVETAIDAAFDAALDAADYTSPAVNLVAGNYEVTLLENFSVEWTNISSTAAQVFSKTSDETVLDGNDLLLSDKFVISRPEFLEVEILETSSFGVTSRSSRADFLMPTDSADLKGQKISFATEVNSLNVKLYREHVSGVSVPLTSEYDLVMIPA